MLAYLYTFGGDKVHYEIRKSIHRLVTQHLSLFQDEFKCLTRDIMELNLGKESPEIILRNLKQDNNSLKLSESSMRSGEVTFKRNLSQP